MSSKKRPTVTSLGFEKKEKKAQTEQVKGPFDDFLHSGIFFSAVMWVIQLFIQLAAMYIGTLFCGTYFVTMVTYMMSAVFSEVDSGEMLALISIVFIMLVIAMILVRVLVGLWKILNYKFGKLRKERKDYLAEKYGVDRRPC